MSPIRSQPFTRIGCAILALTVANSVSAQSAYFSCQGVLNAPGDKHDLYFDLSREVGSSENLAFLTFTYAGGINAAGDAIPTSGFDAALGLYDCFNALRGRDDSSGPGLDCLLSWASVQPEGIPLNPDPLPVDHYRLNIKQYNDLHTGPWAVDLIGPADAIKLTGAIPIETSTLDSLKFGTTGSGDTSALVEFHTETNVTGELCVANTGKGSLTVGTSGMLYAGELEIGKQIGSIGSMTVNSANCYISTYTTIGDQGQGTLNIQDYGAVNSMSQTTVGLNSNAVGVVNVSGWHAIWDIDDSLYLGYLGQGTLNINSGGEVLTENGFVGLVNAGHLNVCGEDSALHSTGSLVVGYFDGDSTMRIENGGFVSNDHAYLAYEPDASGIVTVTGEDSHWFCGNDLNIGGGGSTAGGDGELILQDFGLVSVVGSLRLWPNGTVNLDGGRLRLYESIDDRGGQFIYSRGAIETYDPDLTLYVDPAGLRLGNKTISTSTLLTYDHDLNLSGKIVVNSGAVLESTGGFVITNGLTVATGAAVHVSGGFMQANKLTMATGSSLSCVSDLLYVPGPVQLAIGSELDFTGGAMTLGHPSAVNGVVIAGTVRIHSGTLQLYDANDTVLDSGAWITLGESGTPATIEAGNGLTLDFGGNITGYGSIDTPDDPSRPTTINGHITGNSVLQPITLNGYIKGVGTLDNVVITGTDAPGFSTTTVYRGSVEYAGTLLIEVGGTTIGSYDRIEHSGIATLGGTLEVQLINGYTPALGDSIGFLFANGGYGGSFTDTLLPDLSGMGLGWLLNPGGSTVFLEVIAALEGDLNGDGFVGLDDLDIVLINWNQNVPPADTRADPSGDGYVGLDDLDIVLGNWNAGTPPCVQTLAPFPEPYVVVLWLIGVCCLPCRRYHATNKQILIAKV